MVECSGCENGRVLCKLKERALSSTVEESVQQTSIAHSGSPHNVLHSLVLVSTYCQSRVSTSVSESESTESDVSTDDKTATIQYEQH